MSKLIFAFLLVIASQGGVRNPHCPFLVGVDMPAGKYPTKQVLYFVPPFEKEPRCFVDLGEAHLLISPGAVLIAGKPSSRVVVRCVEAE